MFVKINKYLVVENEEKTFAEMIKLEQTMNAVQAGLDSYNLFKDKKNKREYWLVEFWISEVDYIEYQKLDSHKYFLELLKGVLERKHDQHFCDVIF